MSNDNLTMVKEGETHCSNENCHASTPADTVDDITIITVKQSNLSMQPRNEEPTTRVPVGAFSLTLRNAGLGNLALSLGKNIVNMIEASVQLAAHFLFRNSGAGNSHATADRMLSFVQIIQNQIEIWQRAHVEARNNSIVAIDGRIIEMSINEEIERMQNSS